MLLNAILLLAATVCTPALEAMRLTLAKGSASGFDCQQLLTVAKKAPFTAEADGQWQFDGERQTRAALAKAHGINPPPEMIVYGYLEAKPVKDAPRVLVFGYQLGDRPREWALVAIAQSAGHDGSETLAESIGERSEFERILIYKHGNPVPAVLIPTQWPEYWHARDHRPKISESCQACEGWLCEKDPIICFADFNGNGRPEYILNIGGMHFGGPSVWEEDANGRPAALTKGDGEPGDFEKRDGQWLFVPVPTCESGGERCGLGDSSCYRPIVSRYVAAQGRFVADVALTDLYYPIKEIAAPTGCDTAGLADHLLLTPDHKTWLKLKKPH